MVETRLPTAEELAVLPPERRFGALTTSRGGLADAEVLRRLAVYGANEPVRPPRRRRLGALLANFTHTLALLLWFAAGWRSPPGYGSSQRRSSRSSS